MRRIGTLSNEREARTFSDYLCTLDIDTQVSGQNGEWDVWLLEEDQLERGRAELDAYRARPQDPKYAAAAGAAKARRDAELQAVLTSAKQQIDLRERWERPVWMQFPVTFVLIGLCLAATLLCRFGNNHEMMSRLQVRGSTVSRGMVSYARDPLYDVRRGEVWRLVTPIFIHMGPIHLVGNMLMMLMLGRMIEAERGSWRLLLYVVLTAVISNLAQNAFAGPLFGGLSGVVYGLFGYVWVTGRLDPHSGLQISRESIIFMLIWLLLCTTGAVGPIANYCHFVGLACGMAIAGGEVLSRRMRA